MTLNSPPTYEVGVLFWIAIESLQGQLLDVQEQIATAKAQELLLEDKTNQVSELKKQIDLKNDEIENLKEQLSEEKSKGFFAKIFGRK